MKKFKLVFVIVLFSFFSLFLISCDLESKVRSIQVVGETEVVVGNEVQYTAVIKPSSLQSTPVTWTVEEVTGQATIDSTGLFVAVEPGTVKVKASADSVEGELEVTISQPVTSVSVEGPETVILQSDETYTFEVEPENASYTTVTWSVLAGTGSATITNEGVLTPVSAGTVTVRVVVDDIIGVKMVTIVTPIASVEITGPSEVRMEDNPTYSVTVNPSNAVVNTTTWSVVDGTGSATISEEGVLTPVSAGMIKVCVDADGVTDEFDVELFISVDSITISGEESILPTGRPTYVAEILPANAKYQNVVWSVEPDTGSATISAEGVLTPESAGTVKVIAKADNVEAYLIVVIEEDDRSLGTPRPTHLLATPENTIFVDGAWEKETDVPGLDVTFARQVYDVTFSAEASKTDGKVIFSIPNSLDLSRMQYFAIKVTGSTMDAGVNPTVSVNLKDFTSGLNLYNDQQTEIEITQNNQWIIFSVSNRYRLQSENRDLKIVVDPHFTASGNEGIVTFQRVVFFGNAEPVTEPQLLTPFKTPHWESAPEITAEMATDEYNSETVDVVRVSATASAVSGWKGIPAYVLEDISRKTTITFKVKLLSTGLSANPKLQVCIGDKDITNVTVTRPAAGTDPTYQTVTVTIPVDQRTESSMWANRYVQIKPNGVNAALEFYVYDLQLTGDADPTPVTATRTNLGGANFQINSTVNYTEGGTTTKIAASDDDPAHFLYVPGAGATLGKVEFGFSKSSGNATARSGLNGVYVKIQGTPGLEVNLQQGWADGWADASQRRFVLDGTVQEINVVALNRSTITTGTGWMAFQFNITLPADLEGVQVKIFDLALTAIFPTPEPTVDKSIAFGNFVEGGNNVVDEVDTMTVAEDENGDTVATVHQNNAKNHLVGLAVDEDIRYMNKLKITLKGAIGTKVTIKLAYGNMFNMDTDYVHTFTTNDFETIEITILDRDALKVPKISISFFFDLAEVAAPTEFIVREVYFFGLE